MKSLQQAHDTSLEMLDGMGRSLEPGDDWTPVVFTYGRASESDARGIIMIPDIGDPEIKQAVCDKALPDLLAMIRPQYASIALMGWTVEYPDTIEGKARRAHDEATGYVEGAFAEHPYKREIISITTCDRDGTIIAAIGSVERSPAAPPAVAWKQADRASGRFPEALASAMKASARE